MIKKFNTPRLRFPGFTDEWEQRKLGDYLSIPEKEILEVRSSNDLLTVKLNLGGVELGASRDTLSLGSTVYYKRYAGQFIYGKQNFFHGSMGIIPQNLDGKGSSADVPSFNISNIEANYLYTYVSRESYWRPKVAAASGTGSKRIHEKTLLDFNIDVPSINEQKLISNTFYLINSFIILHQHKITNLIKKKKSLLQKLFPINGNPYPEIRFPGFNDAWEQCKLGDLAEIVRGASPRPISDPKWFDNDSNVGWLRIADVTAQDGRIRYLEQKISELGQEKTRVIKTPHLLLSIAATVGKPVINYVPTGVHDGFLIFLNPKFNILYAFWWLEMFREKWNKYGQPGSQVNLNSDLVKNQVINIPNEKEQEKISSFLESLDKIITLHQRKLNHLKLQKKALLQQLFV